MVTGSERQFLDRLLIRVQQGNIEKTVKTALLKQLAIKLAT